MKKNVLFILLTCLIFTPVFAQNFSAGFSFGVMNGSINEYVEDEDYYNGHMSQLDWDVKDVKIFDIYADLIIRRRLLLKTDLRFGLPGNSGFMQDYDWLNPYSWPKDPIEELTNYSKHTNKLTNYYKLSETIGFNFFLPLGIAFSPFMLFETEEISFDGLDGYSVYKSNKWMRKDFSGNVISYEQSTGMVFFGLTLDIAPVSLFDLQLSVAMSPKMTDVDAIDRHRVTRVAYWDHVYNADLYKAQAALFFNVKKTKIGLTGDAYYLPEFTGATTSARLNSDGEIRSDFGGEVGTGGTSRFLYNVSVVMMHNF